MERSVKPQPIIPYEVIRSGPIKVRPSFTPPEVRLSRLACRKGAKKSVMPLCIQSKICLFICQDFACISAQIYQDCDFKYKNHFGLGYID
jgi:hypothetical protein